jgi:imidazolonepropionase-like amidohydrolase
MKKIGFASLTVAVALTAAEPVTAIKAARMFDGTRDHVTSPGLVVVSGGKITAVGKDAAIPAGAVTIDLGDATLLPGFMDAHTHLSMPFERDYRVAEQAGKLADIVACPGNPEENIRVVEKVFFVMRDGVVFRNR